MRVQFSSLFSSPNYMKLFKQNDVFSICISIIDFFVFFASIWSVINKARTVDVVSVWCQLSKMTGSIKLFQFFQRIHQTLGIHPSRSNQKKYPIEWRKILFLVCFAQILFTAIFMLDAKSMFDYGFAFFLLICLINAHVIYLIFIWESENTLEFIQCCEVFIEKSK